jgi:F0F1-type ATP synthase membrane subunit b/b'
MPHLDLTYFFNQSFWCIIVFLLVYFTASRNFYAKYNEIIMSRNEVIQNYIDKSNKILLEAAAIEEQLEKSKRELSLHLQQQEERIRAKIYDIRRERLSILKKEIENRNLAHKLFLNNMKGELAHDLKQYSSEIEEKINLYLFE